MKINITTYSCFHGILLSGCLIKRNNKLEIFDSGEPSLRIVVKRKHKPAKRLPVPILNTFLLRLKCGDRIGIW